MKILFVARGEPDYQSDTIFHGLYHLLGADFTHSDDYYFMYKDQTNHESLLGRCYGRGFSMWGNLPTYLNDNSDIENKIKNKYFDYVFYGSIRRSQRYFELVKEHYPKNKICFIEGEDEPNLLDTDGIMLFKRELFSEPTETLKPISFGIPPVKIVSDISQINKTKDMADYIPQSSGRGYVYTDEEEYYNNYRVAKFGLTMKKAGWDCMRHYEILANYCIPFFENLHACPPYVMTKFPKQQIIDINNKFQNKTMSDNEYYDCINFLFEYTKNNLTTVAVTKYVLETLGKYT